MTAGAVTQNASERRQPSSPPETGVAIEKGIPTVVELLGEEAAGRLVQAGRQGDLLIGNNAPAQVPRLLEIIEELAFIRGWGGGPFVLPIPDVRVWP